MSYGIDFSHDLVTRCMPPTERLSEEAVARHVMPRFDALLEDLPALGELPDPQAAARLSRHVSGLPMLLDRTPNLGDVRMYAQGATDGVPEVMLTSFDNGATLLHIGDTAKSVKLSDAWGYVIGHANTKLHTHPVESANAAREDQVMNQLPSDADLDAAKISSRRTAAEYIAHVAGVTYYEALHGIPDGVLAVDAVADYYHKCYPGIEPDDTLITVSYLDFLTDHSKVFVTNWHLLPQRTLLPDLGTILQ